MLSCYKVILGLESGYYRETNGTALMFSVAFCTGGFVHLKHFLITLVQNIPISGGITCLAKCISRCKLAYMSWDML